VQATRAWVKNLPQNADERLKLEALWVTWGAGKTDVAMLKELLNSEDHRIRSAAVRVLRFNLKQVKRHKELLAKAAADSHGRVRMEATVAASFLGKKDGLDVLAIAEPKGMVRTYKQTMDFSKGVLENTPVPPAAHRSRLQPPAHLSKPDAKLYVLGEEIYNRDAHCATCHQPNGKGLPDSGFPPLAGTSWANGDPERLIKLTLKGLLGPIEVQGKEYPGQVPMTPFEALLNDEEIAAVLTFARNSFGNKASVIKPAQVSRVRGSVKEMIGLYNPADLLKTHPHDK
jgi:mono/diheme cytochrome c family protein